MSTRWLLEHAWLGAGQTASQVLVEVEGDRFTQVVPDADPALCQGATPVPGLSLPGFANSHSHAFHRALRGHTQAERGTFWTWRDTMYDVARRLTPDTYHRLARAVFGEMVAAGWTTVGEFHYLHHDPQGQPYPAHAMEEAVLLAAAEAGIRITLLDTAYFSGGFGAPPLGVQRRYSDGSATAWEDRVLRLAEHVRPHPHARLGVAVHSVRAVEPQRIGTMVDFAAQHDAVLHAHVSEQVAENTDCLAAHGATPTQVLADQGALGPRSTWVHATHLTPQDIAMIGAAGASVCFCPTTERDLADGIGPGRELVEAGAVLTVGTDSHAVVDPFEELRAVELDERLASRTRGHWSADELLVAGTSAGHRSLGWDDVGSIAVGQAADLVTLDLTTPRTAGTGTGAEAAVFAGSAADVRQVMVAGVVVHRGDTREVGARMAEAVAALGVGPRGAEPVERNQP